MNQPKGCGGHLGRHLELHLSAPHLEYLPEVFVNLLWVPYKDQESKLGDMIAHRTPLSPKTNSPRGAIM